MKRKVAEMLISFAQVNDLCYIITTEDRTQYIVNNLMNEAFIDDDDVIIIWDKMFNKSRTVALASVRFIAFY